MIICKKYLNSHKKMLKTYSCRRDLSRRQRWLYASRSGAETTDLELVLDPNEPNGSPILVPVHACILVSLTRYCSIKTFLYTYISPVCFSFFHILSP